MRLAIIVNDLDAEEFHHDAPNLACTAFNRGHEVWIGNAASLTRLPHGAIAARARSIRRTPRPRAKVTGYLRQVRSPDNPAQTIQLDELDVVMFRDDPANRPEDAAWTESSNASFGRLLAERRVIVLNDPMGNLGASTKVYLAHLPGAALPSTLVSRDWGEIKSFASLHGRVVLKPMRGTRGNDVFLLRGDDRQNANQMIAAVARHGLVVAQEYVSAADTGDVRLLLVNGVPLERHGRYAAVRRVAAPGDFRNNGHAGAERLPAQVTDAMLRSVELIAPRIIRDGLFLVGADLAGDKVLELNVLSPGGIGWASRFEGIDFYSPVIDAIERKVEALKHFGGTYVNAYWATFDPLRDHSDHPSHAADRESQ